LPKASVGVTDVNGHCHLHSLASTTPTVQPTGQSTLSDWPFHRRSMGVEEFAISHPSPTITHHLPTRTEDIPSAIQLC